MQPKKQVNIIKRNIASYYLSSSPKVNKGRFLVAGSCERETPSPKRSLRAKQVNSKLLLSIILPAAFVLVLLVTPSAHAQKKPSPVKPKTQTAKAKSEEKPGDQLAKLREEYIKATNEYKELLKKQAAGLEKNIARAENRFAQSQQLFTEGLISRKELDASEAELTEARDKVTEVKQRLATADTQIADTLLEAEAETQLAKSPPVTKGKMLMTASLIRFNGGGAWALTDAWKVQRFFLDAFKKPLPIAVFGQGNIHDRWRLDHHNSMDVSLHPDGPEGQSLLSFLRSQGIPFLAFRGAIPGTATGPHIHIGRPSHRY